MSYPSLKKVKELFNTQTKKLIVKQRVANIPEKVVNIPKLSFVVEELKKIKGKRRNITFEEFKKVVDIYTYKHYITTDLVAYYHKEYFFSTHTIPMRIRSIFGVFIYPYSDEGVDIKNYSTKDIRLVANVSHNYALELHKGKQLPDKLTALSFYTSLGVVLYPFSEKYLKSIDNPKVKVKKQLKTLTRTLGNKRVSEVLGISTRQLGIFLRMGDLPLEYKVKIYETYKYSIYPIMSKYRTKGVSKHDVKSYILKYMSEEFFDKVDYIPLPIARLVYEETGKILYPYNEITVKSFQLTNPHYGYPTVSINELVDNYGKEEITEILKVHISTLNTWLRGRYIPSYNVAKRIVKAYNVWIYPYSDIGIAIRDFDVFFISDILDVLYYRANTYYSNLEVISLYSAKKFYKKTGIVLYPYSKEFLEDENAKLRIMR